MYNWTERNIICYQIRAQIYTYTSNAEQQHENEGMEDETRETPAQSVQAK